MAQDLKVYRGKYSEEYIDEVLKNFRFLKRNVAIIKQYFCEGIRIRDLNISKQLAYGKIRKVVNQIKKEQEID